VTATIPVSGGPFAVAVNPKTNSAYVANADNTVSVLGRCRHGQ
jgi:DNA-binding beta-propeller fold protein YncE